MGAGSSARKKLDAEKKLREDAERKAEAETRARKKLEDELREAKRELESVRSQMHKDGDGRGREKMPNWKPCRTNKTLEATWSLSRVIVYHDGENCWVSYSLFFCSTSSHGSITAGQSVLTAL